MSSIDSPVVMKLTAWVLFFGSAIALIGVLPIDNYNFYIFLRWVLFSCFVASLFSMIRFIDHRFEILFLAPIGAILFNPFSIIAHEKSEWVIYDIIAALLLTYWAVETLKVANEEIRIMALRRTNEVKLIEKLTEIKHGNGSRLSKYKRSIDLIDDSDIELVVKQDMYHRARIIFDIDESLD